MKKRILIVLITILMVMVAAACGSSSQNAEQEPAEPSGSEEAADTEESESVHPYAWLGLQDIPECDYLDALASNHYYKESDVYIKGMSYVSKEINARDGIDTYKKNENSLVYSIGGKIVSVNDGIKSYMEEDMSYMAEDHQAQFDEAMEKGTNLYRREFEGTGSEAVPVYSEQEGDDTEYEYYEYSYPDFEASGDNYSEVERFYLKDGDVFAVYTKITMGDTETESAEIIKKMTGNIPEGTFDIPDLSDYEKIEY